MISPWVPAVLYTLIKIPLSRKKIFLPGVSALHTIPTTYETVCTREIVPHGGGGGYPPTTIKASNQIPLVVINALGSCSNSYVMPSQSLGASRRSPLNGWWRRGMRAIRLCFWARAPFTAAPHGFGIAPARVHQLYYSKRPRAVVRCAGQPWLPTSDAVRSQEARDGAVST